MIYHNIEIYILQWFISYHWWTKNV